MKIYNQKSKKRLFVFIGIIKCCIVIFLLTSFSVYAVENDIKIIDPAPNPSAAYCEELGYEFIIKDTPEGQIGVCKISDSIEAPAWDFLRGKEATEYNYCGQKGYKMKITDDPEKCGTAFSRECVVCVLEDGREVEANKLLEAEKTAGPAQINPKSICNSDGKCVSPENEQNCPQDCLSPAKTKQAQKAAAEKNKIIFLIIAVIIIIAGIITVYYFIRKKKEGRAP